MLKLVNFVASYEGQIGTRKKLVVNRKGLPALFLPKFSAEIRQKDFLIRKALSVYLQKLSLSAESISFCRKTLFL